MLSVATDDPCVYLIHFAEPFGHAQHYLGASIKPKNRMKAHMAGTGGKLIFHVLQAGIDIVVARLWITDDPYALEAKLKKHHYSNQMFCPICHGSDALKRGK